MKSKGFATAAAVLTATTALVALLCLMGQGNPPAPHLALAAPMAAPTVTAVDPASAPNDLDTPIVITGTGFTAGMTVTLGSTRLPDATWVSATMLTATVPWGLDPGVYSVTVTNPDGQSGSKPNAFTVTQGLGVWTGGGGPYGGYIDSLAINPNIATTLYAAVNEFGLFRSRDGGENWELVLMVGNSPRVDISPMSPNTAYAGSFHKGLYRSDDGGDTWIPLSIADLEESWAYFRPLAHPTFSQTVYVAVECGEGCGGVWKSEDRGQHWISQTHNLTDTQVTALAFDPTAPLTMYVGTYNGNVFRSTNGGESWEFIGQPDASMTYLAVNPFGAHELWGAGGPAQGYLWKYDSLAWTQAISVSGGSAVVFDQNISGTIWVGAGHTQYKSTDGGQNWMELQGLPGYEANAFAIDPTNSQVVYLGLIGQGVYKTTDGGASWREVNHGLAGVVPERLALVPGDPSTLYATGNNVGPLKTTNWASDWFTLPTEAYGPLAVDPFTHTRIYIGRYQGINISEDGGANWHQVSLPMPPQYSSCCQQNARALRASPGQPGHLVVGVTFKDKHPSTNANIAGGIYTSTDFGESWTYVDVGREISPVLCLAYDPVSPTVIYAGTSGYGGPGQAAVLKSTDSGHTWQYSTAGLTGHKVESIAVEPVSPHRVFASGGGGLRVSTDGGATWTAAQGPPMGDNAFRQILYAPGEPPVLYAATSGGAFRTWDGTQTWQRVEGALGFVEARYLAIVTTTGRAIVYAATPGGVVTGTTTQMRSLTSSGETLLNPGVYRYTTRLGSLQAGNISGPTTGLVQRAYTFTATVIPLAAALPITYTWQATGLSPVTHISGLSDTVVLTWSTPSVKVVTVLADNGVGAPVADVYTVTIDQHHIYLPLVLRGG